MEAQIDHQFGRVLAKLDAMGMSDETVVVFTSDYGEFLGNHGLLHKGPPPYRDLCRMSFVIAGPGIPRAERRSAPSSHLDLAPTLLALAGVDARGIGEDGESLVPVFEGGWLERRERFLELHPRIDACVYNHFIVTDRWRLTLYPNGEREWGELFNLEVDPGEHENLFHDPAHRAVRDRLAERLVLRFPPDPNGGTAVIAKW